MKTTFSYFQGMFENPAPAKIIFKKKLNQKYYEILTIRMRRKVIALSPLSFFANTPFKITYTVPLSSIELGTLKL